MMTPYASQLRQVRDSLTLDNWHKGTFFSTKNNKVCMCVHGAAQALVNPVVKEIFNRLPESASLLFATVTKSTAEATSALIAERYALSAAMMAEACASAGTALLQVWAKRQAKYKTHYVYQGKDYGNYNLHYLMGMFGITSSFNDHHSTSLEMLKAKLSEAADWAEQNEEFLQSN